MFIIFVITYNTLYFNIVIATVIEIYRTNIIVFAYRPTNPTGVQQVGRRSFWCDLNKNTAEGPSHEPSKLCYKARKIILFEHKVLRNKVEQEFALPLICCFLSYRHRLALPKTLVHTLLYHKELLCGCIHLGQTYCYATLTCKEKGEGKLTSVVSCVV